ncbi:rhamnan synthesis F family protein [Mycetocola sp. 2940]|uniref:rhamnan synthesis F family protein n=1 Tax=Mycetocola sp. 2940 TaxID=3156452 RepID=UPI00339B7875
MSSRVMAGKKQTVLRQILDQVTIEGTPSSVPPGSRVALFASYSADARVSRSIEELVTQLQGRGYFVILIRASESTEPLRWPTGKPSDLMVIRKPNIGYDFGSWSAAMAMFPDIRRRPHVLLVNDSIVGPFASIDPLVDLFESSTSDAWSATTNLQVSPHLQSFFTGFRNGTLATPVMREFWTNLPNETAKHAIIDKYEFGLTRALFSEGFSSEAAFPSQIVGAPGDNPVIRGWRTMLELGFPFVKRELLTNPTVAPDGHLVREFVEARFGTDPLNWL